MKEVSFLQQEFASMTRISFVSHEFPFCERNLKMKIVILTSGLLVKFPVRFYIFPAGNTHAPVGENSTLAHITYPAMLAAPEVSMGHRSIIHPVSIYFFSKYQIKSNMKRGQQQQHVLMFCLSVV